MAAFSGQDLLLIAGGVGMAPLRSLLLALLKQRQKWGDITVLYGAREVATLLFMDELLHLKEHGEIELLMAADHPGTTLPSNCRIALLPALLEQITVEPLRTCAALCGPPAVYPPLISTLQMLGLGSDRIYLSLERHMKCGIGRCGHCAVGTRLCCTDGPVFSCAELSGIEGAFG
jgi:NAD(P)H-flavin reductase